jgi:2-dehydropantoate 2-reductase
MHIAVIGVGGVAGYFCARLAQAGEDVTFIARGEPLRAMRTSGLRVESVDGDPLIEPISVTDDPVTVDPVDIVLLAVKSRQASEAIESMRLLMGAETLAIPLLNGVEAPTRSRWSMGMSTWQVDSALLSAPSSRRHRRAGTYPQHYASTLRHFRNA